MPDMVAAKKVVARRYRVVKRLIVFHLAFWVGCVAAVAIACGDDIGWNLGLFALIYLVALAMPYIFVLRDLKMWCAARRDLKNHCLIQKQIRMTGVCYRSGYRGSFSAHLIDSDCEQDPLFVKTSSRACSLLSWLKNVPATIEYLEGSHLAVTVYLDISSTRRIPEELTPLFEESEGYTRFVKGKKKEDT